jgi:hypothetical protein
MYVGTVQDYKSCTAVRNKNTITLCSISGNQIFKSSTDKTRYEIDVKVLDAGIYFLRIESGNYVQTVKVFVAK